MFLATTALETFWDTSQPILFLGEWCKLYNRKSFWEKLNSKTVQNPYYNNVEIQNYTTQLYEKLLPILSDWLNRIHHTQHSLSYWRILVGPFLLWYIQVLYDRYLYLKMAYTHYSDLETIGLASTSYFTPLNIREFVFLTTESDAWNLQLFTQLLMLSFKNPNVYQDFHWYFENHFRKELISRSKVSKTIRARIKRFVIRCLANLRSSQLVGMCMGGFYRKAIYQMIFESKAKIFPLEPCEDIEQELDKYTINWVKRNELPKLTAVDDFSCLVLNTLKINMPLRYIELYEVEDLRVKKCYPYKPQVIFSSIDVLYNDHFKLWGAKKAEEGVSLVAVQHGGANGMRKYSSHEMLERTNCNAYLSWGWSDTPNVIPVPSFCINRELHKVQNSKKQKNIILWVGTSCARYQCSTESIANSASHLSYIDWQSRFSNTLTQDILSEVVHRLYINIPQLKWFEDLRLKDLSPHLKTYLPDSGYDFIDQLKGAKLFISDNLNTTFSYGMALNVPTLLFLDPTFWELQDKAQIYFNVLKDAGIYHTSPESAAKKVNEIARSPQQWWNSKKVQDARDLYCKNFVTVSPTWVNDWVNVLLGLLKLKINLKGN